MAQKCILVFCTGSNVETLSAILTKTSFRRRLYPLELEETKPEILTVGVNCDQYNFVSQEESYVPHIHIHMHCRFIGWSGNRYCHRMSVSLARYLNRLYSQHRGKKKIGKKKRKKKSHLSAYVREFTLVRVERDPIQRAVRPLAL